LHVYFCNIEVGIAIALNPEMEIDDLGRAILEALQRDARLSFNALAREVGCSQPAVAERVRRMEEAGVLTGYRAIVARDRVGLPITAFLRLACGGEKYRAIAALSQNLPEVLECYHVTGEDCFFIKLAVDSLNGLERVVERFRAHGSAIVTIALSCVAEDKPVVLSASEE
jgi:Lrp/AsnC family leucine-responsive transcriptional regulator